MFLDGLHLKSARTMAGMSQQDLADAAGLHVNSVKYWENRCASPLDGHAVGRMRDALSEVGISVSIEHEPGPAGIVRFDQFRQADDQVSAYDGFARPSRTGGVWLLTTHTGYASKIMLVVL